MCKSLKARPVEPKRPAWRDIITDPDEAILTSGDVTRVTGISIVQLHRMVRSGFVSPKNAQEGSGVKRLFSFGDLYGVAVSLYLRSLGFDPGYAGAACRLVSDLGSKVIDDYESGRSWLAPGAFIGNRYAIPGRMIEPPKNLTVADAELVTKLNLSGMFSRLVSQINRSLAKRPKARERDVLLCLASQLWDGFHERNAIRLQRQSKKKRTKRK